MGSDTLEHDAGVTSQAKEGFERTHLQEKIQFYNVARGSAGEVRSLLYVISDNFVEAVAEAERLRQETTTVGKLVTGLLNSTIRRRGLVARVRSSP
jgi:four helix bundle protein